jgi:hypothetical protein
MKRVMFDFLTKMFDAGVMIPFFLLAKNCNTDGTSTIKISPNIIRIIEGLVIAFVTAILSVVATTWIMTSNLQIQQKNAEADIIEHNVRMRTIEDKVNALCTVVGVVNSRLEGIDQRQQERITRETAQGIRHSYGPR